MNSRKQYEAERRMVQTDNMSWPVSIHPFEPTDHQREAMALSRGAGPLGALHPNWNNADFWRDVVAMVAAGKRYRGKALADGV